LPFLEQFFFTLKMPRCIFNDKHQAFLDFRLLPALGDGTIELIDEHKESLVILVDFRDPHAHAIVPLQLPGWSLHCQCPVLKHPGRIIGQFPVEGYPYSGMIPFMEQSSRKAAKSTRSD
jgi:hypothetical protein